MLSSLLSSLLMIVPGKGEEKAVSEGPLVVYWDINRLSPVNMLPNAPPVPPTFDYPVPRRKCKLFVNN